MITIGGRDVCGGQRRRYQQGCSDSLAVVDSLKGFFVEIVTSKAIPFLRRQHQPINTTTAAIGSSGTNQSRSRCRHVDRTGKCGVVGVVQEIDSGHFVAFNKSRGTSSHRALTTGACFRARGADDGLRIAIKAGATAEPLSPVGG